MSLDREIVAYLLANSKCTVPQLANALNQPASTVEYHVQKLVERGVLQTHQPRSIGARVYGRRYSVKHRHRRLSSSFLLIAPTMLGVITLFLNPYAAAILLLPSAAYTLTQAFRNFKKSIYQQAEKILQNSEKIEMK